MTTAKITFMYRASAGVCVRFAFLVAHSPLSAVLGLELTAWRAQREEYSELTIITSYVPLSAGVASKANCITNRTAGINDGIIAAFPRI